MIHVFDAYGTLLDIHSAVGRHAGKAGAQATAFSVHWRQKQLEYTWVRTLAGRYRDFEAVTADGLDAALAAFPSVDAGLRAPLLQAYRRLDAYPDAEPALARLRASGERIAVLSNGTPAMLDEALAAAGIAHLLDAVLSVDALKAYKTVPEAYGLVTRHFGVAPSEVLFHSSNRWDVAGAAAFGFRTVWVNRDGAADEYADLPAGRVVAGLA